MGSAQAGQLGPWVAPCVGMGRAGRSPWLGLAGGCMAGLGLLVLILPYGVAHARSGWACGRGAHGVGVYPCRLTPGAQIRGAMGRGQSVIDSRGPGVLVAGWCRGVLVLGSWARGVLVAGWAARGCWCGGVILSHLWCWWWCWGAVLWGCYIITY